MPSLSSFVKSRGIKTWSGKLAEVDMSDCRVHILIDYKEMDLMAKYRWHKRLYELRHDTRMPITVDSLMSVISCSAFFRDNFLDIFHEKMMFGRFDGPGSAANPTGAIGPTTVGFSEGEMMKSLERNGCYVGRFVSREIEANFSFYLHEEGQ